MRKMLVRLTAAGIALFAGILLHSLYASTSTNSAPAGPLRAFLQNNARLTKSEMQSVQDGKPVAKLLDTKTNDEVAIFGIVKIQAPPQLFIEKYRDIIEFESGAAVHGTALFHTPPELNDVADLEIDKEDLKEIPECKRGDCGVKLSDRIMRQLREQIDWKSPEAYSQAQSLIRQSFVDYVSNYQKIGDDALSVYNDKDKPQAIREGFNKLLLHSSDFYLFDSRLIQYLKKYPQEKPPDTEDLFYWQKVEFGLKPVVRGTHVVIHRTTHDDHFTYAIASKMLFASHYFRAAIELKTLAPDPAIADAKSFYLLCLNRSFVDGLTGFKGVFIRGTVKKRSRQSLEKYLGNAKTKLESAYKQS